MGVLAQAPITAWAVFDTPVLRGFATYREHPHKSLAFFLKDQAVARTSVRPSRQLGGRILGIAAEPSSAFGGSFCMCLFLQ